MSKDDGSYRDKQGCILPFIIIIASAVELIFHILHWSIA